MYGPVVLDRPYGIFIKKGHLVCIEARLVARRMLNWAFIAVFNTGRTNSFLWLQ